jgi:hypothetical protein
MEMHRSTSWLWKMKMSGKCRKINKNAEEDGSMKISSTLMLKELREMK